MVLAERTADFGAWLRRSWNTAMEAAEAMERSPMEDVFGRLDRLERDMAALKKNRKAAGIDGCYNDSCDGEFSHLCEDYGCVAEGSLSAVMRGNEKPQSQRPRRPHGQRLKRAK